MSFVRMNEVLLRSLSTSSSTAATITNPSTTTPPPPPTTTSSSPSFAVVDHSDAYESAMSGRHGQQLALASLYGVGRDDEPFDPFADGDDEIVGGFEALEGGNDGDENEVEVDASEREAAWEASAGDADDDDDEEDDDDDDEEDDDDDYEETDPSALYNRDGSVRFKKSHLAAFQAGAPAGGKFAVLDMAGTQFKVTVDDLLIVNKLLPVDKYAVGTVHTLRDEDILLVGSSHKTAVGMPFVQGAEVDIMIEEITRDQKVIIFKKRRRKHSQRKQGFRREVTMIRILDIRLPSPHDDHDHLPRPHPEEDFLGL